MVAKIHLSHKLQHHGLRDACDVPHFLYYDPLYTYIAVQKDKS
jgi:hypothetical protein